jgi:hypothetical protein
VEKNVLRHESKILAIKTFENDKFEFVHGISMCGVENTMIRLQFRSFSVLIKILQT